MNLSIASQMRPGTTVTDKNAEGFEMFSRAWYKKIRESGEETDCIYKLNDRILLAKDLRVEKQVGPECVEVFHTELREKFLLQKMANGAENISKWINCPTHSNIVTAFHQFDDLDYRIRVTQPVNDDQTINEFKGNATYEKTKGKFILVEPSNFGTLYGFINRLGQIIDDQVKGKMIDKFKRAFYSEKERMKYKQQGQISDVHINLIYLLQDKLKKDKQKKPTDEEIYKIYEVGRYAPSNKPVKTSGKTPCQTVEEDDEEAPKERAKIDFSDHIIFQEYIKFVYNIAIQLSQGLDHSHSNNLYHGQLDTSKVKVHRIELPDKVKQKQTNETKQSQAQLQSQTEIKKNESSQQKVFKKYMYHFKISEYTPIESILLMKSEVLDKDIKWDFEPKKKEEIQPKDVIEDLKFKDIYCLGVCLMELMVGRFGKQNTLVSLDQIPEVWSREPQCLALYEALRDCLEINSSTQREGKLKEIRLRLTESYKTFFYMKEDALLSEPYVSVQSHVKNKLGLMQLFQMKDSNVNDDTYEVMAKKYFKMALHLQKDNFNAAFNLGYLRFTRGQDGVDAGNFITTLNNCENAGHGGKLTICFQMGQTGNSEKAIEELSDYISELDGSKAKAEESQVFSVSKESQKIKKPPKIDYKKLKEAEDLKQFIVTSKNNGFLPENIKFKHEQTTPLKSLSFSASDKYIVSLDEKSVVLWEIKLSQAQKYIQFDVTGSPMIATTNDSGNLVGILSKDQSGHHFKIFETENGTLKTTLSNPPSIPINELDHKAFNVLDLRFVEEEQKFSLYVKIGNENLSLYFFDITYTKEQKVLNVQQKKSSNYFDDRSPNNFVMPEKVKSFVSQKEKESRDQELVQKQKVQRLIKDNFNNQIRNLVESNQNIPLSVPIKSDKFFAYYIKDETAIYVFNCKRNRNVRFYYQGTESFKAFALSNSAKYLAYFDSHYIRLETVQLVKPNAESIKFDKYAKYRYVRADDQVKSGQTNKQKTTLKERMVRDIRNYQIFQEAKIRVREEMRNRGQKVDENSNEFKNKVNDLGASLTQGFIPAVIVEMMLYKYNTIINKPALMKMNKEFSIMQKILMQESQNEFDKPPQEIWQRYSMDTYKAQKRIDVYDSEIPFPPNTQILDVQMSSEPLQNFMLVLVGTKNTKQDIQASQFQAGNMSQIQGDETENSGKVYKFDLNTRELIFQFDALVNPLGMILFDGDDKLLLYNKEEIQIWDFDNSGQGLPQLIDDACYLGDTNKFVQESTAKINTDKTQQLVVNQVYINENCEGDSLVLVDFDEVVYLYRSPRESDDFIMEEGKMKIDIFSNPADKRKIESVNFSHDSSIIYIGDGDGFIHFIDSNTGQYFLDSQPFDTRANWPNEVVDWLRNKKEREDWKGHSDFENVKRNENQLVSYSKTKAPAQPKPRSDSNARQNTAVTMIQRFGLYNKKGYEIYLVVIGEQVPLILDMFAKFDKSRKKITSIAPKMKAFSFGETYRPIRDVDSVAYSDPKYSFKDKNLENQIQLGKYFRNYQLNGDEMENQKPFQEQFKICQAQIALNCQFFVIGFAKDVSNKEIKLAEHLKAVEPFQEANQSQFLQFNNSSAAKRPPATGMVKSKPSNMLSPHQPHRMETASNYQNSSLVPNFERPETGIAQNMGRPLSGKSNVSAVTKKTIKEKREQKEKENNTKRIKANSGLGIWFFDCDDQKIEQRKWILEVDFINFSVDDHLATVCFWLRDNKSLDLQYMLWEFGPDLNYDGPNKIDWNKIKEIDEGHTKDQSQVGVCGQNKEKENDQEEDEDDDDDEVEIEELLKMEEMGTRLNASRLCTLF